MIRRMGFAVAATTALLGAGIAPAASASNVNWNVSIGLPGFGLAVGAPGFGYAGPAPVVVGPPLFIAPPPPVYFRQGPCSSRRLLSTRTMARSAGTATIEGDTLTDADLRVTVVDRHTSWNAGQLIGPLVHSPGDRADVFRAARRA